MCYCNSFWIILVPFLVFLSLGLFGHRLKPMWSGIIGTLGLSFSAIASILVAWNYFTFEKVDGVYKAINAFHYNWLIFNETLKIDLGVLLDPISVMMLVVITLVSLMVHIYSLGYMKGEKGFQRFYAFLSLFTFSMLGLVVAVNIFQMYIFWELVGVSSYLLIGFYYEKPAAVLASKKAFIVTRFADMGFLIGILLLSYYTKTFDFIALTSPAGALISHPVTVTFMGVSVITWALLLIFMGGAGKSAMFPLHIWLPDAMEGPTPVSALIHAATMVVAGVYLVARLFPVYALVAPDALRIVAYVGGFTSIFAAIIACTQFDIKRVLAFSTMSQIGYMMLALGVSGYGGENGLGFMASMFHLTTHAMFKALLFLGAGAIIHAVHTNSMQEMGGLRKHLPITHITFLIACLAISGIPPLSGFFSKDEILVAAFQNNHWLFFVEYLVAGLTAFYMFRLYYSIFWREERQYEHTPHEAPKTMTIPLIILAIATLLFGFLPFDEYVTSDGRAFSAVFHPAIAGASVFIALLGIFIATILYKRKNNLPERAISKIKVVYQVAYHKFYMDELYLFVTKKIIFGCISKPIAWFDRHIVDGFMNGIAWMINFISINIKGLQSGQLQKYAWVYLSGVVTLLAAAILLLTR
jgi:NADH-quinone oxidoreductase subunit L